MTDPLGHVTKTYKDASGRTIRTVYDDGSFTQTAYGVADGALTGYPVYTAGTSSLPVIPAGGSETVGIAQHFSGNTSPAFTIDVYDASGNWWTSMNRR